MLLHVLAGVSIVKLTNARLTVSGNIIMIVFACISPFKYPPIVFVTSHTSVLCVVELIYRLWLKIGTAKCPGKFMFMFQLWSVHFPSTKKRRFLNQAWVQIGPASTKKNNSSLNSVIVLKNRGKGFESELLYLLVVV